MTIDICSKLMIVQIQIRLHGRYIKYTIKCILIMLITACSHHMNCYSYVVVHTCLKIPLHLYSHGGCNIVVECATLEQCIKWNCHIADIGAIG